MDPSIIRATNAKNTLTNNGDDVTPGENIYTYKYDLLFNRPINEEAERTIGLPRTLICMRTILSGMPYLRPAA